MSNERQCKCDAGFSLIEVMFACFLLSIGMAGGLIMIMIAIESNNRNKLDTSGTAVAQVVMEQLNSVPTADPTLGNKAITITDCAGNVATVQIAGKSVSGGTPTYGVGAPLVTTSSAMNYGTIDFTQPTVTGYSMNYTTCGGSVYDVRWWMQDLQMKSNGTTDRTRLLVVASRFSGAAINANGTTSDLKLFAMPVNLRTIVGP